MYYLFVS